jgi:hypothetical protein
MDNKFNPENSNEMCCCSIITKKYHFELCSEAELFHEKKPELKKFSHHFPNTLEVHLQKIFDRWFLHQKNPSGPLAHILNSVRIEFEFAVMVEIEAHKAHWKISRISIFFSSR